METEWVIYISYCKYIKMRHVRMEVPKRIEKRKHLCSKAGDDGMHATCITPLNTSVGRVTHVIIAPPCKQNV